MALQTVVSEAKIGGFARKEKAWEIISNFARYPEFMENVDDVRVLEKSETEGKSEWEITLENAPFAWVQKDVYFQDLFKIEFESVSGDFDQYNGSWSIEETENGGILICHKISYELGIPVIGEVLGEVLKKKMLANLDSIVSAIKQEISDSSFDERRHAREMINAFTTIAAGKKHFRVEVKDLSPSGMRIASHEHFQSSPGAIEIATFLIEIGEMVNDRGGTTSRILFAHNLSEDSFSGLVASLRLKKTRVSSTTEQILP